MLSYISYVVNTWLSEFWRAKITNNISRDRRAARLLRTDGWRVLRLWAKDLQRDPEATLELVLRTRKELLRSGRRSLTKNLK